MSCTWRSWCLTAVVAAALASLASPASGQTIVEPGWQLLRTINLTGAHGARFDPANPRTIVVGQRASSGGLYRVDEFGMTSKLATANNLAGVLVHPVTGDLFFSEDGSGLIYRLASGATAAQAWVNGLHSGDDDPVGMALVPMSYSGSVVQPGAALVVDRGDGGPDEVWLWSTAASGAGTVLHSDNGTLVDALDVAVSDTTIYVVDRGSISVSDGAIYTVGTGGALTPLTLAPGIPLVDPLGVAIDPTDGTLLVADGELLALLRVDPGTGVVSTVLGGLPLPVDDYGPVDISPDGTQLAVTVDNKVLVYGRCAGASASLDCDGNGVADVCDFFTAQSAGHRDCDLNGVLDSCDLAAQTHTDCNLDSVPDVCPICPPVEAVFIMDTSPSMLDEATALCTKLQFIVSSLKARGIDLQTQLLAIAGTPGAGFSCLSGSVVSTFGTALTNNPPASLGPMGTCPSGAVSDAEDWGRAVAVTAATKAWTSGALRAIVVLSDEGPHCGDPVVDPGEDRDAVDHAIKVALLNDVVVSVVTGSGASAAVNSIAADLAAGTGGTTFASSAADRDLAQGVRDIVVARCKADFDCDDNGLPDECQVPAPVCPVGGSGDGGVGDGGPDGAAGDGGPDGAVVDGGAGDGGHDGAMVDGGAGDGGPDGASADAGADAASADSSAPADAGTTADTGSGAVDASLDSSQVLDASSAADGNSVPADAGGGQDGGQPGEGGCSCELGARKAPDMGTILFLLVGLLALAGGRHRRHRQ